MRQALLAIVLVLATLSVPAVGQGADQTGAATELELRFTLNPQAGTIDVALRVLDPGVLSTLTLRLGELDTLKDEPTLEGSWSQEGTRVVADLERSPKPVARWTADARIQVESLEGEGHTSYVGDAFAVVKAGDVMPSIQYTFPEDEQPRFDTQFTVNAPDGWAVEGPWRKVDTATFRLDGAIPRGFLAADDQLETARLNGDEGGYRIIRVAGAQEDQTTEQLLLEARQFLKGVYGPTIHQRFIVVAPDPMFRGGLGSPDGVFLHASADASVVAHEMVHAYQGWQFSRSTGEATVWLAEGAAVVHGKLLEVAAGVTTRDQAQRFFEEQHREANREHAKDLTRAVYGTGIEEAAYVKGAVVVTALDDRIRDASDNEYTLSDVLKRINAISTERGQGAFGADRFTTSDLIDVIGNVTRFNFQAFFDAYVYGQDVPELGAVFPGQASVRILGTEPSPAVAGEPVVVRVALSNLDTDDVSIELPILVNGAQAGTLRATLAPGDAVETTAEISPLPRGNYTLKIQQSTREIPVLGPPQPVVEITVWPPTPTPTANVTVGVTVGNQGQAPFRGPLEVRADGRTVVQQTVPVAAGQQRTFAGTLSPWAPGEHTVTVQAPNGSVLAEETIDVAQDAPDRRSAPGLGLAFSVAVTAAVGCLVRARRRT